MPSIPEDDPTGVSDEVLMESLRQGKDYALAALMERWEVSMKVFLLRLGVPPSDVEDIAQEAFLRLYRSREKYRVGAPFKPWLLTIAGNLARNRLRWRFRRREESIQALDSDLVGGFDLEDRSAPNAPAEIEIRRRGAVVQSAINALPSRLREALVYVEIEDLTYRQAARVAGCSEKAIETRLYRAKQSLRSTLRSLLRD